MINDSKIFLGAAITFLALSLFFATPAIYSKIGVESQARNLLQKYPNNMEKMKEAYLLLRQPQLFAGYENFDSRGIAVKNTLQYMDSKLFTDMEIKTNDSRYIGLLLERRAKGSNLGAKTAVFFLLMGILSFFALLREKRLAG